MSINKIALLNCYEAFASTLGKVFEIHVERILPNLLSSLSDSKINVREAARKALDCIMANISGLCVKKMLPMFLEGMGEANWRTKVGQTEALCSMVQFAARQVAIYLPQIIDSIKEILLDTHPKVQEVGHASLGKITTTMRNQGRLNALAILEVQSQQITDSNAEDNLEIALNKVLDVTFVHSLDDPSFSLLMPLIIDGLESVKRDTQIQALRILGNICSLLKDKKVYFIIEVLLLVQLHIFDINF
jgi:elongation factor 3